MKFLGVVCTRNSQLDYGHDLHSDLESGQHYFATVRKVLAA